MPAGTAGRRVGINWAPLFGYDFFISYKRGYGEGEATAYARALTEELRARDCVCFFDEHEMPAGEPIRPAVRRALRRSRALVLIATDKALQSPWVRAELEIFRKRRRGSVVPINVGGALGEVSAEDPLLAPLMSGGPRWIDVPVNEICAGKPGPEVCSEVPKIRGFVRANRLRRGVFSAVATLLTLAGTVAIFYGIKAGREADRAEKALLQAEANLGAAVGTEAFRLQQEKRLLAANALLASYDTARPNFELTVARSAARESWFRFESELSLGTHSPEWVRLSPNAESYVVGTLQGRLLFAREAKLVATTFLTTARTNQVAFSKDGRTVWIAAEDEGLFRLGPGDSVPQKINSIFRRPTHLALDPLGHSFLIGQAGEGLYRSASLPEDGPVRMKEFLFNDFAWSSEGEVLAATDYQLRLHLWLGAARESLPEITLERWIEPGDGPINFPHAPLAVDPGGRRVAAAVDLGEKALLFLFELPSRKLLAKVSLPAMEVVRGQPLRFSADGENLLVLHKGGISSYNAHDGSLRWQTEETSPPTGMALDPQGRFLAAAFSSGSIKILELSNRSLLETLDAHRGEVRDLTISADGRVLVSAGLDGLLRRWRIRQQRKELPFLFGERQYVQLAAFGTGGKVAVALPYATGPIWVVLVVHPEKQKTSRAAMVVAGRVTALAFNEDGSRLTAGTTSGEVLSWVESQTEPTSRGTPVHSEPVEKLLARPGTDEMFSIAGRELVLLGPQGQVRNTMRLPESWSIRKSPLVAGPDSLALEIVHDGERSLVRWAPGRGWIRGPILKTEPNYLIQLKERVLLVGTRSIQEWREGEDIQTIAPLNRQVAIGAAATVLPGPEVLVHVLGGVSIGGLQLGIIDLQTGREEIVTDPDVSSLLEDSWSSIMTLGPGSSRQPILSLTQSGLLRAWGVESVSSAESIRAHTGLVVRGVAVYPGAIEDESARSQPPPVDR